MHLCVPFSLYLNLNIILGLWRWAWGSHWVAVLLPLPSVGTLTESPFSAFRYGLLGFLKTGVQAWLVEVSRAQALILTCSVQWKRGSVRRLLYLEENAKVPMSRN